METKLNESRKENEYFTLEAVRTDICEANFE